jgi:small subunit ribosomal protein S1
VKHPSEVLKKGDQIQAILTAIDVENRRISLSIKEFRPNEWEQFASQHHPGDLLSGTVAKVADFGVFVRLPEGLEGLMHVSETEIPRGDKPSQHFKEGDAVRVKVLRIEAGEQRIGLSSRSVPQEKAHAPVKPTEDAPSPADDKPVSAGTDPSEA